MFSPHQNLKTGSVFHMAS